MKKFRIVTDSFCGYEAQVKYALFPFVWFQLNDYKGVNSWNNAAQAVEFINQKKAGITSPMIKTNEVTEPVEYQVAFKSFIQTGRINTDNVVWQESFLDYLLKKSNLEPAAGSFIPSSTRNNSKEFALSSSF